MTRALHFSLPCRSSEDQPAFDLAYLHGAATKGHIVALLLDLNVLARIHDVVTGELAFHESPLCSLVQLLQQAHDTSVTLVPGVALNEAAGQHRYWNYASFDAFVGLLMKHFVDAHDCLVPDEASRVQVHEHPFAIQAAASLLIAANHAPAVSGCEVAIHGFRSYLDEAQRLLPMVSIVDIEVARHIMASRSRLDLPMDQAWIDSRAMADNFTPTSNRKDAVRKLWNAAGDMVYVRMAQWICAKRELGRPLDVWLVTCDRKLHALLEVMRFPTLQDESRNGKFIEISRRPAFVGDAYWDAVDDVAFRVLWERRMRGVPAPSAWGDGTEAHYKSIIRHQFVRLWGAEADPFQIKKVPAK